MSDTAGVTYDVWRAGDGEDSTDYEKLSDSENVFGGAKYGVWARFVPCDKGEECDEYRYKVQARHPDYGWSAPSESVPVVREGPTEAEPADYERTYIERIEDFDQTLGGAIDTCDASGKVYTALLDRENNATVRKLSDDEGWSVVNEGEPETTSYPEGDETYPIRVAAGEEAVYAVTWDAEEVVISRYENGSWGTENLAGEDEDANFGWDSRPAVDIAVHEETLYAAVRLHPDDGGDLLVYEFADGEWEPVEADDSTTIASGDRPMRDVKLTALGDALYLHWREIFRGSAAGDVRQELHIRLLDGNFWEQKLEGWEQAPLRSVELAGAGDKLFFMVRDPHSPGYHGVGGGIYRVDSATVTGLTEEVDWFMKPHSITTDEVGNVVAVADVQDEAGNEYPYPGLFLYDGSEWKTVSTCIAGVTSPVQVAADGTDIVYIAGDRVDADEYGRLTGLQTYRFSP